MTDQKPSFVGKLFALVGALLTGGYMLNPTGGLLELPDNLPMVGNLDELIATLILAACLRKLGLNIVPGGRRDSSTVDGEVKSKTVEAKLPKQ